MGDRVPRAVAVVVTGLLLTTALVTGAAAVSRDLARALRDEYEGRALQLRLDLDSAAHALEPNVLGLGGIAHGRENGQVIFYRLETVYVDRVTSEGGSRLTLTLFRSGEAARRLRSQAIPPAITGIPSASGSIATYAASDSTTVALELEAGRKDPEGQRREIETLLGRLFYLESKPTRDDLTRFVAEHRDWPVTRLATLTGLPPDTVREILAALGP